MFNATMPNPITNKLRPRYRTTNINTVSWEKFRIRDRFGVHNDEADNDKGQGANDKGMTKTK
jgi:hypothetical protein